MPEPDRPLSATSVVPFLYGVADRSWLPGSVLVRLLTDLGSTEDDARRALARMRRQGALSSERRGREIDFKLVGLVRSAARLAQAQSTGRLKEKWVPVWEGSFAGLLYGVPRDDRPARNGLRRAARLAGYGPLRPGMMIGFRNSWTALADTVADLPPSSWAAPVTLGLKPDDARRAAVEAWRLDRAATKITVITEQLEEAAAQPAAHTGVEALRRYVALARPAYRIFVRVPPLPVELTPEDWPAPRMITALAAVREGVGGVAAAYVGELLSRDRSESSADPAPVGE